MVLELLDKPSTVCTSNLVLQMSYLEFHRAQFLGPFSSIFMRMTCKIAYKMAPLAFSMLTTQPSALPACRRLLFPLLHAEKGRPFSACNKGNRRRLHAGNRLHHATPKEPSAASSRRQLIVTCYRMRPTTT